MNTTEYAAIQARAEASFAAAALDEGIVDVATATIDTPIGELLVAATAAGIVRVAFHVEQFDRVNEQLALAVSPRLLAARTPMLGAAVKQLGDYFAGQRRHFDLPLDLRLASGPFRREVLASLATIPLGTTRTYRELAVQSGRPNAVRAVGSGCANNPVPVIVPCHRVLRTGGELGGYLGGVEHKRWLLDHEQRLVA